MTTLTPLVILVTSLPWEGGKYGEGIVFSLLRWKKKLTFGLFPFRYFCSVLLISHCFFLPPPHTRWSDHAKWSQDVVCFPQKWLLCSKVSGFAGSLRESPNNMKTTSNDKRNYVSIYSPIFLSLGPINQMPTRLCQIHLPIHSHSERCIGGKYRNCPTI